MYLQFYRHQIVYHHPTDNCTSISVDTLRALGWSVPRRGPSRPLLAWLGFPWIALRERSVAKAKLAFDYLAVEQTRLLPAAAIEEAFGSLWSLAHGGGALEDGALARLLAEDLSALAFARLPQFPSSRAWGDAPALTTDDYRARIPKDPALQKIIPLPARPFPEDLRDPDVLPPPTRPSDVAARVWGLAALAGLALAAWGLFGVLLRAAS